MTYRIKSKPPAMVLLINNRNFPHYKTDQIREGSNLDVRYLTDLFRELGYPLFRKKCIEDVENLRVYDSKFFIYFNANVMCIVAGTVQNFYSV